MYLKNDTDAAFHAVSCDTSFDNDCRMVVLTIFDEAGFALTIRVPEYLMASMTGQFMRERLFGLH